LPKQFQYSTVAHGHNALPLTEATAPSFEETYMRTIKSIIVVGVMALLVASGNSPQ
jgi:hypothetical protein